MANPHRDPEDALSAVVRELKQPDALLWIASAQVSLIPEQGAARRDS